MTTQNETQTPGATPGMENKQGNQNEPLVAKIINQGKEPLFEGILHSRFGDENYKMEYITYYAVRGDSDEYVFKPLVDFAEQYSIPINVKVNESEIEVTKYIDNVNDLFNILRNQFVLVYAYEYNILSAPITGVNNYVVLYRINDKNNIEEFDLKPSKYFDGDVFITTIDGKKYVVEYVDDDKWIMASCDDCDDEDDEEE
jgi:hypothetical protein|nr:MAG: hypothetical protein TU36_01630 [Vulcanisaeta sp. AZ3]